MPDMQKMMQQAAEMQAEMARRQAELAEQTFEGSAGGGVVTAVVRGDGHLESVTIDPSVLDPDDAELVGDLVVAAVAQAHEAMAEAAAGALGGGAGLDPGALGLGDLDLGDLGDLGKLLG
jgi:DNA-binding YbaB/EbfC family protein